MKRVVFSFALCLVLVSCNKDYVVVDVLNNCPEMYDFRSKEYVDPYLGTLQTNFPGSPQSIYPDSIGYLKPCANPSNPYEFCYFNVDYSKSLSLKKDLYKYNFCSGRSSLIIANIYSYEVDWSIKDWILFTGESRDLWKIKSNGDSLTRLTNEGGSLQYDPKWNTDGSLFKWSANKIADVNGKVQYSLPSNIGFIVDWYDKEHLLHITSGSKEVHKFNINSNESKVFAQMSEGFFNDYHKVNNEFLGVIDSANHFKNFIYDVNANQTTYLGEAFLGLSFRSTMIAQIDNRILLAQTLADTMTGTPSKINSRQHIAIMDKDGSNIRQILLD